VHAVVQAAGATDTMKVPPANTEALAALNELMGRRTSVFLSVPDAKKIVALPDVTAFPDDGLARFTLRAPPWW